MDFQQPFEIVIPTEIDTIKEQEPDKFMLHDISNGELYRDRVEKAIASNPLLAKVINDPGVLTVAVTLVSNKKQSATMKKYFNEIGLVS